MKKGIRITVFTLLLLTSAGLLTWYFFMKRRVPEQASCIPKNVIAVLTLNLRELALDGASGNHLFPEMEGKQMGGKAIEQFTKSIESNGGSGLRETSDVVAFFYQDGEAAFFGIAAVVKDSLKFGNLLRNQLMNKLNLQSIRNAGTSLVQFDTTSIVIGWNHDIALLIYPFSNEEVSSTAKQCAKLLAQSKEQSVLSNENFKEHELTSFDAGIWIQAQPLLAFTQGGHLFRAAFSNVKTVSMNLDFRDGELDIRSVVASDAKNHEVPFDAMPLLTCDAKQVNSFWRIPLDLQDEKLFDAYVEEPPMNMLPLSEEQTKQLATTFNGNCTMLMHDTFSYDMKYLTYDYDENFERITKSEIRRENDRGISVCYELKDENKARQLLTEFMKLDSIPLKGNRWVVNDNGQEHFLMLSDKILTVTNWPQSDGKKREIPDSWQGLDLFLPIGDYLRSSHNLLLSMVVPQLESGQQILSENIKLLTLSKPLVVNNSRSSEIRLILANKEVNALIQFEELFWKIQAGGK